MTNTLRTFEYDIKEYNLKKENLLVWEFMDTYTVPKFFIIPKHVLLCDILKNLINVPITLRRFNPTTGICVMHRANMFDFEFMSVFFAYDIPKDDTWGIEVIDLREVWV